MRHFYGLSRHQALALPHWEFRSLVENYYRLQARHWLNNFQSVNLGFNGGKDAKHYVSDLKQQAGWVKRVRKPRVQENSEVPWTFSIMQAAF